MNQYTPDVWVMLKLTNNDEIVYKILAGWYGEYTGDDYWRLNSGCINVKKDGESFVFDGTSGSSYLVSKNNYRLNSLTNNIFMNIQNKFADKIQLMNENTDWLTLRYLTD